MAQWTENQRQAYKRQQLAHWQVQRLKAVPGCSWDAQHDKWAISYSELKQRLAKNAGYPRRKENALSHVKTSYPMRPDVVASSMKCILRQSLFDCMCWQSHGFLAFRSKLFHMFMPSTNAQSGDFLIIHSLEDNTVKRRTPTTPNPFL